MQCRRHLECVRGLARTAYPSGQSKSSCLRVPAAHATLHRMRPRQRVQSVAGRNGSATTHSVGTDDESAVFSLEQVSPGSSTDERQLWRSIGSRTLATRALVPSKRSAGSQNHFVRLLDAARGRRVDGRSWWDVLLYNYYNNRQGTADDLRFFAILNAIFITTFAVVRSAIEANDDGWLAFYNTFKLIFGEFSEDATFPLQLFSTLVVGTGFVCFALVLALTEQTFLEGLDANVRLGSPVLDSGHIVLLAFGRSPRDLEMVAIISRQMSDAHADVGGTTIVVLSEVAKLEMEKHLRNALPMKRRHGCTIVVRQGNPMLPEDLRMVGASRSAAAVIIADQSRSPVEADSQSVRVAVMLDELDFPGFDVEDPRKGHVIVEMATKEGVDLVRYSCSERVIPVATASINARRLARMLQQPIVSLTTRRLWNFSSTSRLSIEAADAVVGRTFEESFFSFADATPVGVVNSNRGYMALNPPASYVMRQGDEIVMIRNYGSRTPAALEQPLRAVDDWEPSPIVAEYFERRDPPSASVGRASVHCEAADGAAPSSCAGGAVLSNDNIKLGKEGVYMIPAQYLGQSREGAPMHVLICGWKNMPTMCSILHELDRGQANLPLGSHITFFNDHDPKSTLGKLETVVKFRNLTVNHERGDPLLRRSLERLDLEQFDAAVVLCDERWMDPDENMSNGYDDIRNQGDLLRLDSMVMHAQLNIRKLLEYSMSPDINIVCEKLAHRGVTRFEDIQRLPLGISVNFTSFSGKLLALTLNYPKVLIPFATFGDSIELAIFDSSWLCRQGERIPFAAVQRRGMRVRVLVIGHYTLPQRSDMALSLMVNPISVAERLHERVWNDGSGSGKFLALVAKAARQDKCVIKTFKAGGASDDDGGVLTSTDAVDDANKTPSRAVGP